MPTSSGQKAARLEARIPSDLKDLFIKAAELRGLSLTEFVLVSVTESAHRVIQEQEMLRLSERDQAAFAEALLEPPEPTERLRRALRGTSRQTPR